jgi:hypothetical protein
VGITSGEDAGASVAAVFAVAADFTVSSAQSKRVGASKKATAIVVIIRIPNLIVAS